MKQLLAVIINCVFFLGTHAQSALPSELSFGKNKSTGKKLLKQGAIEKAVEYLEAAAAQKPGNKKVEKLLAPAELQVRNYAAAEKLFSALIEKDKKAKQPQLIYYKAIALQQQEKFEEAIEQFALFREVATDDQFVELVRASKKAIDGCRLGIAQHDSAIQKEYKVEHIPGLNSSFDEQSVAYPEGKMLLFSRWDKSLKVSGKKALSFAQQSNLQIAERSGGEWKLQGLFAALTENTEGVHITTPSFSEDGLTMYFSACKEETPLHLRCDILKSHFVNGAWQKAEKLNNSINLPTADNIWPHVGKAPGGEECLYFSSNRNPGKGYDLFYAVRNGDGSFQRAKTLSAPINTKGDEIAPFYDYETNTLFFSSNGMGGMGGFDVFGAKRLVIGDFLDPENLGAPINSGADDYGFIFNTKKNSGFLVSNRASVANGDCTTCNDDIWLVKSFKIFPAVRGEIQRWRAGLKQMATDAFLSLINVSDNVQAGFYQAADGKFFFELEPEKDYKLTLKREGATDIEQTFTTKNLQQSDTLVMNFVLDSVPAPKDFMGVKIATVFWDYDKFQLTSSAPDSLKKVVDFYFEHPQYIIEVGSHTDGKGDDVYNLKLSERRGAAVVKYLLSKKIPAKNIFNNPYGESRPIAPNTTSDGKDFPEGRALNRRTEFVVFEELKK